MMSSFGHVDIMILRREREIAVEIVIATLQ